MNVAFLIHGGASRPGALLVGAVGVLVVLTVISRYELGAPAARWHSTWPSARWRAGCCRCCCAGRCRARSRSPCHVVLMDLRMPRVNGIVATQRLRQRPRPPEVVVLTTFDTDENVLRALRAGASGFLLNDTPPPRIVEAVRRVAAGDPILSPGVTRRLMDRVTAESGSAEQARRALRALSPREREVALELARGRSNAEIADGLGMTVATVKAHVSHVLTKLGLGNRTQVALLVHDAGLV